MTIASIDELVEVVDTLVGASYDKVSDEGKEHACNQALQELRWSLPNTNDFQCHWIIERARRHFCFVLLVESAHKFRFKQIHLQNRFAQYHQLIKMMDAQFAEALENNMDEFDFGTYSNAEDLFIYLTPGFQYDYSGVDISYLKAWK